MATLSHCSGCHVAHGLPYWGLFTWAFEPLHGVPTETGKGLHVEAFIYVPQISNLPTTRTSRQSWNAPFIFRGTGTRKVWKPPASFCRREMPPSSPSTNSNGVAPGPGSLPCRRESAPHPSLGPTRVPIATLSTKELRLLIPKLSLPPASPEHGTM